MAQFFLIFGTLVTIRLLDDNGVATLATSGLCRLEHRLVLQKLRIQLMLHNFLSIAQSSTKKLLLK